MKRQRGRGRKPGGGGHQNPNKAYDSQGPDVRVRGSAQTIFEKYQTLARDCLASGDRILAENYLQHAEHYLRLIKSMQPGFVPRADIMVSGYAGEGEEGWDEDDEGEGDDGPEAAAPHSQDFRGHGQSGYQQRREFQPRESRDHRELRDNRDAREPREPREARDGRDGGDGTDAEGDRRFGRNRRRRDRFRTGFEADRAGSGGDGQDRPSGETVRDPLAVQGFDDQPAASAVEVAGFQPGGDGSERSPRRPRPPRPAREARDSRDGREARDSRDGREARDSRDAREPAPGFGSDVPSFLSAPPPAPADSGADA